MQSPHDNPTTIAALTTETDTYVRIDHPALSDSITFQTSKPGVLNPRDAQKYGDAQWNTDSKMANDLIDALVYHGCATLDEAEWMMDHWDYISMGWYPGEALRPLANG
jgi:hypothetical protein